MNKSGKQLLDQKSPDQQFRQSLRRLRSLKLSWRLLEDNPRSTKEDEVEKVQNWESLHLQIHNKTSPLCWPSGNDAQKEPVLSFHHKQKHLEIARCHCSFNWDNQIQTELLDSKLLQKVIYSAIWNLVEDLWCCRGSSPSEPPWQSFSVHGFMVLAGDLTSKPACLGQEDKPCLWVNLPGGHWSKAHTKIH